MQAKDIVTTQVIVVPPEATTREIAALLLERRISAVPVIQPEGGLVGIVSEGDLMRCPETGAERHPSWWLGLLASPEKSALAYVKSHGGHARDVMTRNVISVNEEASLKEVAETLERHRVKRVPELRFGKLVGIVSRADLLHGLVAASRSCGLSTRRDDQDLCSGGSPESWRASSTNKRRLVWRDRPSVGRHRVECGKAGRPRGG